MSYKRRHQNPERILFDFFFDAAAAAAVALYDERYYTKNTLFKVRLNQIYSSEYNVNDRIIGKKKEEEK